MSASAVLPCPAHSSRIRSADGTDEEDLGERGAQVVVEKRPSRWIQERRTGSQS